MNAKVLLWATAAGTLLQLAMVLAGHYLRPVQSGFLVGGLLFSAIAGALYAKLATGSLSTDLVAGLITGGLCAFVGILVSFLLGDVPAAILAFGTGSSAVTGLVGAAITRPFHKR